MTACNIACERALAPFVIATKGERSKVASYSEQQRGSEREEGREEGVREGKGGRRDGAEVWDKEGRDD